MRVVLLENVEHLGIVGDVKEVADGYARNFLLPEKLAAKVGSSDARILMKDIKSKRAKSELEIKKLKKLALEINGKVLEFEVKATEKGKMFGAITSADVAEKLKMDKKQIQFAPLKSLGEHKVDVHLGHNVKANIIIKIKSQVKKISDKKEAK